MTSIRNFVILLRCGMGLKTKEGQRPMPDVDGEQEWQQMMRIAKKQAVQGVVERGIRMMPEEQRPPRKINMAAMMLSDKIAMLNRRVDTACVKVAAMMEKEHAAIEARLETAENISLRVPLGTNIPLVAFFLAATTLAYKKTSIHIWVLVSLVLVLLIQQFPRRLP